MTLAARMVYRLTLILLLLIAYFSPPLSAQYTYSVYHAVTSTSSTAFAIANTTAHDGTVRFPSILISCSGACAIRVYEGGTTANTLSTTYPRKTKASNTLSMLSPVNYVKFYTAADSSGGTIVGGGDCAAACNYPITGLLPDRSNRHSMELARKTDSQYYFLVTGSSINVTFSGIIEVVK